MFAQRDHLRRCRRLAIHFKTFGCDLRPTDSHLYLFPPQQVAQVESQAEAEKNQGGRYNLRRRKDDGDAKAAEAEQKEAAAPVAPPPAASPSSPSLDFGGKIGRFPRDALVCARVCGDTADVTSCPPGAYFWLLFLPAWVLFVILQVNLADPSLANAPPPLPPLHTLWDPQALGLVLLWVAFQALLYILPIGKVSVMETLFRIYTSVDGACRVT